MKAPAPSAQVTVDRCPPGAETAKVWEAIGGRPIVTVSSASCEIGLVPTLRATQQRATYLLALMLVGDDLGLAGFDLQPDLWESPVADALLDAAGDLAQRTERSGLIVDISNADVTALRHLQIRGFRLVEVKPLEADGGIGYLGIRRTHRLILRQDCQS